MAVDSLVSRVRSAYHRTCLDPYVTFQWRLVRPPTPTRPAKKPPRFFWIPLWLPEIGCSLSTGKDSHHCWGEGRAERVESPEWSCTCSPWTMASISPFPPPGGGACIWQMPAASWTTRPLSTSESDTSIHGMALDTHPARERPRGGGCRRCDMSIRRCDMSIRPLTPCGAHQSSPGPSS